MTDALKLKAAAFRQELINDCLKADQPNKEMIQFINQLTEDELLLLIINNSNCESTIEFAMYQLQDELEKKMDDLPF